MRYFPFSSLLCLWFQCLLRQAHKSRWYKRSKDSERIHIKGAILTWEDELQWWFGHCALQGRTLSTTLARNFDVAGPFEWIARATSHIPKKGAKQVFYYGTYSQAWRGREFRHGISRTVPDEEEPALSLKDRSSYFRRRRQQWVVLLKKIWDVDVKNCYLTLSHYFIRVSAQVYWEL